MPITDTATLVISCKADSSGVERYTSAVEKADDTSKQLLSTLGQVFSTAAMVRFGNESIAVFSDLQEATQKFYEVFKGNETEAAIAAKKLEESFGASQRSAKSMLSFTGDLLVGFGFMRGEALKLSEQVAQLGSDIASFSNYAGGAEGAAGAITKAMLGETEAAKALGIAIRLEDKDFVALQKSIQETRGVTMQQARALAVLQTAFKQKGTAMGDFERNINSIANRGRMLSNELEDLKANIGRGLSESFSEGQAAGIKLLRVFNDLSPETQDFITKTGAIVTGLFAVKAAMATYNTMQAITGSLTAKNAGAVMMEAKAHEENTRAILAENAAKAGGAVGAAVNPLISIGQQIKANKMQSDLAKHDLFAARRSNAPVAEIKQLEQNYANILRQRKQLYAMRDMEVMTQQAGKFNAVLTGTNKQMAEMNTQARFPTFAAGAAKVRAGLVGIGTAAKGAAVAVGSIAKAFLPMLALSAGIAAVDYLMSRSKRAAEAANALAEAQYKDAQKKSEAVRKEISSQNELFSTLETLSKYTRLTNEEQETAQGIINKLTAKYGDLSGSIKIVNGQLVIARDLTKKLSEEQLKAFVQAEAKSLLQANNKALAQVENLGRELKPDFFDFALTENNIARWSDKLLGTDISGKYTQKEKMLESLARGFKGVANASEEVKADFFENFSNVALKKGMQDIANKASEIAKSFREAAKHNKNIIEAEKAVKGGKSPLGENMKSVLQTTKELEDKFSKIKDSFSGKLGKMEFDLLGSTPEKIMKTEEEIRGLTLAMKEAAERGGSSREKQIEAYKYASEILDLEEQKGNLMRQYDSERAKALEEEATKQKQIYESLSSAFSRFRETAQTGIAANSEQSIRLQSRMFLAPGGGLQTAAKQAAEAAKRSADAAEKSKQIQEDMKQALSQIYSVLENMGVSTVGG